MMKHQRANTRKNPQNKDSGEGMTFSGVKKTIFPGPGTEKDHLNVWGIRKSGDVALANVKQFGGSTVIYLMQKSDETVQPTQPPDTPLTCRGPTT